MFVTNPDQISLQKEMAWSEKIDFFNKSEPFEQSKYQITKHYLKLIYKEFGIKTVNKDERRGRKRRKSTPEFKK